MAEVEQIPDPDEVARLVERPYGYEVGKGLTWGNLFQFPKGRRESLVWRRYAPLQDDVHQIGRAVAALKPQPRDYEGFLPAVVGDLRAIRSGRGHGFEVVHAPEDGQGQHHAEIGYAIAQGTEFDKSDKTELKALLQRAFSDLVSP